MGVQETGTASSSSDINPCDLHSCIMYHEVIYHDLLWTGFLSEKGLNINPL